jgi:hypothetical protein
VTSKGHRRLEVRTLTTSSQLIDFLDRPFLQQVFQRERTTISKTGKTRHPSVYGVTSLFAQQASPGQLLTMLRSSWHIENSLHYPRDVTLHEDQTRFKKLRPLTLWLSCIILSWHSLRKLSSPLSPLPDVSALLTPTMPSLSSFQNPLHYAICGGVLK